MYLAFEGVKGSGKSTLVESVREELRKTGVLTALFAPTGRTEGFSFAELFSDKFPSLRNRDLWNEYLYSRRAQRNKRNAERSGLLVIGDRSVVTSYVTRWNKWNNPAACIRRVDFLECGVPAPDHIIYLDVEPQTAIHRINLRAARGYGLRDQSYERITETLNSYRSVMTYGISRLENTGWHIINANHDFATVKARTMEIVWQLLSINNIVKRRQIN